MDEKMWKFNKIINFSTKTKIRKCCINFEFI